MKYGFAIVIPSPDGNTAERDRVHDAFELFLKDQALGDIHKCGYDHANNKGLIFITLIHHSALVQVRAFLASLESPIVIASWEEIPGNVQQPTGDPVTPGIRRFPPREIQ